MYFARMFIEVDFIKHLPKQVSIEDVNGCTIEQKVQYKWIPPFCSNYQIA